MVKLLSRLQVPDDRHSAICIWPDATAAANGITTDATVMSVITIRNGFSERAFREKILVIRGSLQEPETFPVDAADILAGKSPDFILQPRDIVYIPEKPWTHPEEILDMAMEAFVQSAVASWTGANVGPFIRRN